MSSSIVGQLRLYISCQTSSVRRYFLEQLLYSACGWIPTIVGLGVRTVLYRPILEMKGWAAIEKEVRLRFDDNIQLHQGVYLDEGVYLHAAPNGIEIGANTILMHGAILQLYNFRGIPRFRICLVPAISCIVKAK